MALEKCKHGITKETCSTCNPRTLPAPARTSARRPPVASRPTAIERFGKSLQALVGSAEPSDPITRATTDVIDARMTGTGLTAARLDCLVAAISEFILNEVAMPRDLRGLLSGGMERTFQRVRTRRYPSASQETLPTPGFSHSVRQRLLKRLRGAGIRRQARLPDADEEPPSPAMAAQQWEKDYEEERLRAPKIFAAADAACDSWDALLRETGRTPVPPPAELMKRLERLLRGTILLDQYRRWLSRQLPSPVAVLEDLEWEVLPADFWSKHKLPEGFETKTKWKDRLREERLDFLNSLRPSKWYRGLHLESRQYLVAEFPGIAFAECLIEGNALYYVRTSSHSWREVFKLTKSEARRVGAQRILHREDQDWRLQVQSLIEAHGNGRREIG